MPYVQANGVELYYEEHGQGEPLLLITPTGWPGSVWQLGMVHGLSPHFRTIIFDQRGIGRSEKSDVEYTTRLFGEDFLALLKALDAEPAHVFGFSVGGESGQLMAAEHPEAFRSLILAGTNRGEPPGGQGYVPANVALTMIDPGYDHPSYWQHHLAMGFTFTPEFRKEHPEKIQELADTIRANQAPAKLYVRHVAARTAHWSGDVLGRIRVPTLVLVGSEDGGRSGSGVDHLAEAKHLASEIPGARLALVPGAKHLFPWQAPEATCQAVLEFLMSL
ncbi:MAG TPA: alpha/beta hydrolase [Chloroflexota bacterium]|nr:alpha/beta hydrolase [Chloroflexota bacterium]